MTLPMTLMTSLGVSQTSSQPSDTSLINMLTGFEFDEMDFSEAHDFEVIRAEEIVLPAAPPNSQPGNGQNQVNRHARPGPTGRNEPMQTGRAKYQASNGSDSISSGM